MTCSAVVMSYCGTSYKIHSLNFSHLFNPRTLMLLVKMATNITAT